MRWKDFLYYQQGEKIAIIILLSLILFALILNAVISHRKNNQITLAHSDALVLEFEDFKQSLTAKESIETEGNFTANKRSETSQLNNRTTNQYRQQQTEPANRSIFPRTEKLSTGETILLNDTDTAQWKKIPGIGSTYASRIVKYGNALGGYVNKEQLKEVYGIDAELFARISTFIEEDSNYSKIGINRQDFQSLLSHPYLNYKQVQVIVNLRKKKGKIDSIRELAILDEFTSEDIMKLQHYLDFD